MNIFIIGQATLHWGRLEFGNIGNYYVIEPFFQQLRRVFPDANIRTTLQMSDGFKEQMNITCVPMNYFYGWEDSDLPTAYKELALATIYHETGEILEKTGYIEEVLRSDLVISFHGDIWGQNADFVGPNRFLVGLLKDRTAQLFGKKTVMIAGSPGPFNRDATLSLAHDVFNHFDYVSNREAISKHVLADFGFDVSNVVDSACPAWLFEPGTQDEVAQYIKGTPLECKKRPVIGFILCGWNLLKGPFSREDWTDDEFEQYVKALTHLIKKYDVDVCLMSHSNGFELPPNFKPIRGRDFPLVKRFYEIMQKTEVAHRVYLFDGLYNPKETKAIIANFDMLISGRIHGAVAGLSQSVPTVVIDYGHEPKAHKLIGFTRVAGVEQYLARPEDTEQIIRIIDECWERRDEIHEFLLKRNKEYIKPLVEKQFDDIAKLF
jgi:colanic acid/amylovoran biosynthesis protein